MTIRLTDEDGKNYRMRQTPDKTLVQIGQEFLIACGLVTIGVLLVFIII